MWSWLGLNTYPSFMLVRRGQGWETCPLSNSNFGTDMHLMLTADNLSLVPGSELRNLCTFVVTEWARDSLNR